MRQNSNHWLMQQGKEKDLPARLNCSILLSSSMEIRKAGKEDIPEIVELLKVSLGESMLPKSEKLWRWKHLENPFGQSPVLLAEKDGKIIGVRAFLKWDFQHEDKILKTCRAVDTAVHPDFQGQGIFTKLTKGLLDEIRKEKIDLIYNTPNEQSTQGYIKMGWEKYGKLPLHLGLYPSFSSQQKNPPSNWEEISALIQKIESDPKVSSGFSSKISPEYINWRYIQCPLFPYHYISDGESFLLIYRIKKGKWGNEFRICDLFTLDGFGEKSKAELKSKLKDSLKLSGCRWFAYTGLSDPGVLGLNFLPKLSLGPLVTLRRLNQFLDPTAIPWAWSIGDLEVF
jgi:N-acetylglutamate synthase-like GNAT family acetyltransferase